MKRIEFIFLLLLLLTLPVVAGVVEDAEAELKKLKEQQKLQQAQGSEQGRPSISTQSTDAYPAPVLEKRDRRASSRKRRSGESTTKTGTSSTTAGVVDLDESKKKIRERSRTKARMRDKSDRLLSVLGLAVLALLIALGAWFGSRGNHAD